jgi:Leucine-rich repeat (LRR) protein
MGAPKADFAGLSDCKTVEKVIMSRMPVAPLTVADIGTLTNLRSLEIRDAQLTDADLAKLAPLTGLRELDISGNNCTDAGLKYLHGMTQLADANLGNNEMSAAELNSLKKRIPGATIYP